MAGVAAPATAATQGEFYLSLLRRGVASYEATRYVEASKQLHIAAFGLVDAIEHYQLAQMYAALTHDKLGERDRAREAAQRVIAAERVERRYANGPAPATVRSAFEALAGKLLTSAEVAMLRGGPIVPAPQAPPLRTTTVVPPATVPRTTTTTPQNTTPQNTTSQNTTPVRTPTTIPQTTTKPPAPQPARPAVVTPAPQTTPENTAPATIPPPVPAPSKPKPEPAPAKPAIKPPATPPSTTTAASVGPETNGRSSVEPVRPAASAPRALNATEVSTRLAAAERALNGANLNEARRAYREVLATPGLDHDSLIRIAEGLYRARDFAYALNAFGRIGPLRRGEEPYRYYVAVAAYETGDYARAKKELAAALPYIEITADVARYRTRIEGAQ